MATHLADDWTRFRRFLCMGREPALYSVDDPDLNRRSVSAMKKLIENGQGKDVVREIKKFCIEGRAAKYKPIIYALAICAKDRDVQDETVKEETYKILCDVCKIPTHLFLFLSYCHNIVRECHDDKKKPVGWGRCSRNAVSKWYNDKEPMTLAMQITKYVQRHRWSHKDIMRMAHIKAKSKEIGLVLQYVVRGYTELRDKVDTSELSEEGQRIMKYLAAVQELKHTKEESRAAELITQHGLVREHVPTWLHKSQKVWEALLVDMPALAMIKNLGKMTQIDGLIPQEPKDTRNQDIIIEKLSNKDLIQNSESRIHPMNLLVALNVYRGGKGDKGKLKWEPNKQIVEALEHAFVSSFADLPATNKKYLMIVDVSVSMDFGDTNGMPRVTPLGAAAAIIFMLHKMEKDENKPEVIAFSPHRAGFILPIHFQQTRGNLSYKDVISHLRTLAPGDMDPAKGIQWAEEQKKDIDVFIALTDQQPHIGEPTPKEALDSYREKMKKPFAKLVAVGLAQSSFTMAHPSDSGMLDVAGFDSTTPQVINDFVSGKFSP